MDVYRGAERLMGMDDAVWQRHANPWSGVARFTALPKVWFVDRMVWVLHDWEAVGGAVPGREESDV